MNEIVPRWEFRVFGQDFDEPLAALRNLAPCEAVDSSREAYLVPRRVTSRNVKVRDGRLDIKSLLDTDRGLERWKPTANQSLPLSHGWLHDELLPALDVSDLDPGRDEFDLAQLLAAFRRNPDVGVASVFKRRQRFTVDGCPAEHDRILVNGAAILSMAVESEDADAVLRVIGQLGLGGRENVNYPRALRRVIGFEPWPEGRNDG